MFVILLTLSVIVQIHNLIFCNGIIPDNYPKVLFNSDMDPSGSLNLCITKTCPGVDGGTMESQTGKFGQKTGLLSPVTWIRAQTETIPGKE